jgi:hypothetical protein
MGKTFLCGITHVDDWDAIHENIIPIAKHFDEINWVLNYKNSLEKSGGLLASELAKSNITNFPFNVKTQKWLNRYDFARNRYLFDPRMKEGDFFLILDSLETVTEKFIKEDLPKLKNMMETNAVDALFLHGKLLFARKNEWMYYKNAIHEQLQGVQRAAELTQIEGYENSEDYFTNTRPLAREEFHFVNHFLKYYTYSSIQCLMGAEGNQELYKKRIENRHKFITICKELGINFEVDDIIHFWKNMPIDSLQEDHLDCINAEKILNDAYRYNVLRKKDLKSDWDFDNIKKVENNE